ncbi:2-oxoisovalerate dehydrogenase E1component, alpha subunit [Monoraphidium neglectum]|uniref:2-oxoisovalerate dehydrogenase E1component, alpha subunit n=1 Tax=Monoraphidium neglectum TaxID=145388 RepID=A0A0D2M7S0_9CHLO|nr:2-oxoisovalerate dehydrogenase E1component, alpha subunit [Monoraphidium neglectum]KIY97146.1 2-oxoisovalerate dehydrogenase E1component, alpha subunit [Monoraphidium neglectum]|eukprot:XP_013896166.1 2-oxoisovalerate dehydrogenase E1component, alpha subunit [Monoraphidium neglectum]
MGGTAASAADESIEVPGGRVPVTRRLAFQGGPASPDTPKVPCYRALDGAGRPLEGAAVPHPLGEEDALRLYVAMAKMQVMDTLFYEAQRQGRFSFYMTCAGEEAAIIASAAGLDPKDQVFAQYREQGVLLWRGFSFDDFANQAS